MKVDDQPNRIRMVNSIMVCTVFAIRSKKGNLWYVYERDRKDRFRTVARVSGDQPEARQRRMVLAILKEIAG